MKDWYKLKLQTSETMKLFGKRKNIIAKNGENVQSLETAEVVLV